LSALPIEPFFLEGNNGRLFILTRPSNKSGGCVVFVPPFAEEMNRCRRQITETAARLQQAGYSVVIPDLYGTGDSEGEFEDASWSGWLDDVACVYRWVSEQELHIDAVVAARLGCILAAESLSTGNVSTAKTVFWQPVDDGEKFLKQFLRLRVVASMSEGVTENVLGLRERLAAGEALEVGGYRVPPALFSEIARRKLGVFLGDHLGALRILEISRKERAENSSQRSSFESNAKGLIDGHPSTCLVGEPFWTSSEVVVNNELCDQTVSFITSS